MIAEFPVADQGAMSLSGAALIADRCENDEKPWHRLCSYFYAYGRTIDRCGPVEVFLGVEPLGQMMKLVAHVIDGHRVEIHPAPLERDWMEATNPRYAYRCLPLNIANAYGW
jgi:hypothetical protein